MPIRATITLLVTVVCLFVIFNFKTPDVTAGRPGGPSTFAPSPQSSASPVVSPTASADASATSSPPPTPRGAGRDGNYTGQDFSNQFGDVQVLVTIAGGRITEVKPLQMPYDRQRSAYISDHAGPLLHDEVLQAQSAQIDGVSGATYTSESYAQSVQTALDQANV